MKSEKLFKILGASIIFILASNSVSAAKVGDSLNELKSSKGKSEIIKYIKKGLSESALTCGLPNNHNTLEKKFIKSSRREFIDSPLTKDISHVVSHYEGLKKSDIVMGASDLIFNESDLSMLETQILVESMGYIDNYDSYALLENIFLNAKTIGKELYIATKYEGYIPAVDIKRYKKQEQELKDAVINSNVDDIKSAVIRAIGRAKSTDSLDHLLYEMGGSAGHFSAQAQAVLSAKRELN
jgi:hypothetical protein|tara:strand:+ start:10253 stop:10972 length:720 start_codon:yes stop_codon:yes gene_type:complete